MVYRQFLFNREHPERTYAQSHRNFLSTHPLKTNYLGLTFLFWHQQYKIVKGKLKGGLNSIRTLRHMLPQSKLFQVYRALVESHLRYGNPLLGHLSVTKLQNLQKLQDMEITLIQSAPIKDTIPSATLSVKELIKFDQAVMVHKTLNGQCPEILKTCHPGRTVYLR